MKRLKSCDVSLMRSLLHLFGDVFDEANVYHHHQPSDAYLSDLMNRDDFISLVAIKDGAVLGGLSAYVLHKFEQMRKEIYIYDLGVKKSCRRQGIATKLIEALKAQAKDIGAYVIFVQADQGDGPAIKLYESLGVREDIHHFDIVMS